MEAAEIEVRDEQGNRVTVVLNLPTESERASGHSSIEVAHGQIHSLNPTGVNRGKVWMALDRTANHPKAFSGLVAPRNAFFTSEPFDLNTVVGVVTKRLVDGRIPSTVTHESVG